MSKLSVSWPQVAVGLKSVVAGFLTAQAMALGYAAGQVIQVYTYSRVSGIVVLFFAIVAICIHVAYVEQRDAELDLRRFWKSRRVDVGVLATTGFLTGLSQTRSVTSFLHVFFERVSPTLLIGLAGLLCAFPFALLLRASSQNRLRALQDPAVFLSDEELQGEEEDALNVASKAKDFAERVLSSGGNMIYGVDAPWGTGKTSFVNLCRRHWEQHGAVVYSFEPLRYADDADLVDRFVSDLATTLQERYFIPEIRPTLFRYRKAAKGKLDVPLFGGKLSLEPDTGSVEHALNELGDEIRRLGLRIIVVVDDLDRLSATSAKNVLYAIKKSFNLPAITYVLCYDTEVFVGQSASDGEKAREFLEKFVSVKVGLFIGVATLVNYMQTQLRQKLGERVDVPSSAALGLQSILTSFAEAYKGEKGWKYSQLLGDVRKVKRLVNLLLLLRLSEVEYETSDFNTTDLVHLLLLYLNYPGRFRRIYTSETDEQVGPYSVQRKEGGKGFVNGPACPSSDTDESEENYLLESLFCAGDRLNAISSDEQKLELELRTRACFNSTFHRNLERYLKLIVEAKKPDKSSSLSFYLKLIEKLSAGGDVEALLNSAEFGPGKGEKAASEFWRLVGSRARELPARTAAQVIKYVVNTLPNYSFVAVPDLQIGIRDEAVLALVRIFDAAGWSDQSGKRRENRAEELEEICWWIYGERQHSDFPVLAKLMEPRRGALGVFDAVYFRLYCSPGRSSLFNLSTALIAHQHAGYATTGVVSDLTKNALRELTQKLFALFRDVFISPRVNFFQSVENLSFSELFGQSLGAISAGIESGALKWEALNPVIDRFRTKIIVFVLYQLTSSHEGQSDVGCGFYDIAGAGDSHEIGRVMNEYLFGLCFDGSVDADNLRRFCDYMLMRFDTEPVWDRDEYEPSEATVSHGLDKQALNEYWRRNEVRLRELVSLDRKVVTGNYVATYAKGLPKVFGILSRMAT